MPVNRPPSEKFPEGRHWCAPEDEQPNESGSWTCPECKQEWLFGTIYETPTWETPEVREARLEREAAEAKVAAEADGLQPTAPEPADAPAEPAPTPDAQEPSTASETREDF